LHPPFSFFVISLYNGFNKISNPNFQIPNKLVMANWPPANNENKGVIPAQAGFQNNIEELDSCFRRNDKNGTFYFLRNPKSQYPNSKLFCFEQFGF